MRSPCDPVYVHDVDPLPGRSGMSANGSDGFDAADTLIVLWLIVVSRGAGTPTRPERHSADYRHQRDENPDYFPGSGGGGVVFGG